MDEVFSKVNGRMRYLWRAVDQDGNVLDILVQNKRNTHAAKRLVHKLLKGTETVPGEHRKRHAANLRNGFDHQREIR